MIVEAAVGVGLVALFVLGGRRDAVAETGSRLGTEGTAERDWLDNDIREVELEVERNDVGAMAIILLPIAALIVVLTAADIGGD